jgi:hypothetical protein
MNKVKLKTIIVKNKLKIINHKNYLNNFLKAKIILQINKMKKRIIRKN